MLWGLLLSGCDNRKPLQRQCKKLCEGWQNSSTNMLYICWNMATWKVLVGVLAVHPFLNWKICIWCNYTAALQGMCIQDDWVPCQGEQQQPWGGLQKVLNVQVPLCCQNGSSHLFSHRLPQSKLNWIRVSWSILVRFLSWLHRCAVTGFACLSGKIRHIESVTKLITSWQHLRASEDVLPFSGLSS